MTRLVDHFAGLPVLVTGHTGFKGAWLSAWLARAGAQVHGISLPPPDGPNLFGSLELARQMASSQFIDIRNEERVRAAVAELKPVAVFHLAAQALVRRSYVEPMETLQTNILGTANVLNAARLEPAVRAFVCVTTDKVYENREWVWSYRETDPLGGFDPYSGSKAGAELVTLIFQRGLRRPDNTLWIATARGGNVVGGGDWSEDRIVPDVIRALRSGEPIRLRNPNSVRPWQHVLELCEGYLRLGRDLLAQAPGSDSAWNFGPSQTGDVKVGEIVNLILGRWGRPQHPVSHESSAVHEAKLLRIDPSKAIAGLGWRSRLTIPEAIEWTADWYRATLEEGQSSWSTTTRQIADFESRIGNE
jgi:CDP-glucose 4,6-dehydratase